MKQSDEYIKINPNKIRFWLGFTDKKQLIFLYLTIIIISLIIVLQKDNPFYYLILVYIGIKTMDYYDNKWVVINNETN